MKTIVIAKPLEFNLEIIGEKWMQGDCVNGVLKIVNHSSEVQTLNQLTIKLLNGIYKKVKVKDPTAFDVVAANILSDKITVNGQQTLEMSFKFQLAIDGRITDKDGSVYIGFGENESENLIGNIELNIQPRLMMTQFLNVMDNFLRFKIGAMKFAKGQVEVKLTPPASKEFSQVDGLVLKMCEVDKNLKLNYQFTTKKIEMNGGAMTTEKVVLKFDQIIAAKEFYIYGDSVNQDGIIAVVNKVLQEVKPKFMV